MDNLKDNCIVGIPVSQNQQDFFIGVFKIKSILKFTRYTSRILNGFDDSGFPMYNNKVQREVEPSRASRISDFLINDPDAVFPTNLVLHIPEEVILKKNDLNGLIEIELDEKVFLNLKKDVFVTIIDGQHRVRGIELAIERLVKIINSYNGTLKIGSNEKLDREREYYYGRLNDLLNIELVVSFFIGKTLEYQAMIFSTINRTQKKVSQSLVYSLFGLDSNPTPQRTALEIVLALNAEKDSPFFNRIKLYGGNYSKEKSPPLSQASLVKAIVNLICENTREAENDRYRKRKTLLERSPSSSKILPFRNFYANDQDEKISKILRDYFQAVKDVFILNNQYLWEFEEDKSRPTNILHTTVGFDTLFRIMTKLIINEGALNYNDFYNKILPCRHINIKDSATFSFDNRGKKILYLSMDIVIWPYNNLGIDIREQELNLLKSESTPS